MKQVFVLMAGNIPVCVYFDRNLAFDIRKSMQDASNKCHLSCYYHVEQVNYDESTVQK